MSDTKAELAKRAATPNERTIHDLLERQRPEIERLLPAHLSGERFNRVVFTELRRNPSLLECKPESLLAAMMLSAQLHLEPGPLGHVYLVPFKNEVTWILGYAGIVELARRSGQVRDVKAWTVFESERFEVVAGTMPSIRHEPLPPADRGVEVAWYAVARFRPSGHVFEVLYPPEIEAVKKRSPAGRAGVGPWVTDFDAMARKTCVRRLRPYLPLSPQFGAALEADEAVLADLPENGASA